MYSVDLVPGGIFPVIKMSQNDVGRVIEIRLTSSSQKYPIPSGAAVYLTMQGRSWNSEDNPDVIAFADEVVTITTDGDMTAKAGKNMAKIRIAESGTDIGTALMMFDIEYDPYELSGGEDESEKATNAQKIETLRRLVNGLASGAPPAAASTSEMDPDESTVYINTTDGNWYYWDGSAWQIGGVYGGAVTSTTFTEHGVPADDFAVGEALDAFDDRVTALESGSGGGLTADIKSALLACFANVAWKGNDGQDYYDALENALNPPVNLSSITAVYTQSGTIYDTASLDDLKPDLVVTAHYDNATTQVITNYTLSGTLTEGTSTITVSYGGKSTTFNVTVSVFNTAPVILATDTQWKSDYTQGAKTGLCITDWYSCDVDYDALKATSHYDSTNDYMTIAGDIFWIVTHFPNSQGISLSGNGRSVAFFDVLGEEKHAYTSCLASGDSKFQSGRQNSNYMHADNGHFEFSFTLGSADVDDSYAYWNSTTSGVMPIGVTAGDIIFAGRNTPYWGCSNISEAVVGT